jgi:shikimate kinase
MYIALIGMSNIGKSFCAKNLAAAHGFRHIDCDALIEKKLGAEFAEGGFRGREGMAKWMGFPADASYEKNSRRYLDCEKEVMKESLALLQNDKQSPAVLDTTGSVIYTGADILESLRAATRVIYFEATKEHIASFFKNYIDRPKPVIWGESYAPLADETPRQTLERCYPELLGFRARRYKEIAHVTIPFGQLKNHWKDIGAFVLKCAEAS